MILQNNNQQDIDKQKEIESELSAIDRYLNRVYKFIILTPTTVAMTSAVCYTISWIEGSYREIPLLALILFDITNLIYLGIALYFYFSGHSAEAVSKRDKLRKHKQAVSLVILIQFNFSIYLVPSPDFWAFAPFFALFAVFFFDVRMTSFVIGGLSISTIIAYFIRRDLLFPAEGPHFIPDVLFRFSHLFISMFLLYALTYFGEKYLVEELEKHANYDTLTRLLNRKSMDSYVNAAFMQAMTGTSDLCFMMADIDNFKKVNDTYGHDCGDEVLKYVAQAISTGVKKEDTVFRWGGEEIFVILKADPYNAVRIAERIRKDIEKSVVNYRNECTVAVTVTIGISPYEDGTTVQKMMDDADAKLYWGKQHGKNQVVSILH